jgi:cytochrome c-type biogenesis protein CcmE
MRRTLISLAAWMGVVLLAASALAARADLVMVKDLLAQPDRWHGQAVVVTGVVSQLDAKTSQKGNPYYTFVLTDGPASVKVFSYGVPQIKDTSRVQVEGTYLKVNRVGKYTFHNQVNARRITIP